MDKQRVKEIAEEAVRKLVQERGADSVFPFDAIWAYATEDVPSRQRPAAAKYLKDAGYLEETGDMMNASTPSRAGSLTPGLRAGRFLRPSVSVGEEENLLVVNALKTMSAQIAGRGFVLSLADLANFYLALKVCPLVIQTGISGTGKSKLPRLFARLSGADFKMVCVQPQWSDNSDLFGYTSRLTGKFELGPFTTVVLDAKANPDRLYLVVLDEMNLAPVEHYFSDFLSVIESRERDAQGNIVTDPLPLDLAAAQTSDTNLTLRGLRLPPNVRVVGSANMDETTRAFSPKVLDRAFSIEVRNIDLTAFPSPEKTTGLNADASILAKRVIDSRNPASVSEVYGASADLFDHVAALLTEIQRIIEPANLAFGYRTRDEILLYLWHWSHDGLASIMSANAALDYCISQKILPKIGGTGEVFRKTLEELLQWLQQDDRAESDAGEELSSFPNPPCAISARKVQRMLTRLETDGAASYWAA